VAFGSRTRRMIHHRHLHVHRRMASHRVTTHHRNPKFTYPTSNRSSQMRRCTYTVHQYQEHRQEDRRLVCLHTDRAFIPKPLHLHSTKVFSGLLNHDQRIHHLLHPHPGILLNFSQITLVHPVLSCLQHQEVHPHHPRSILIILGYLANLHGRHFKDRQAAQTQDHNLGNVQIQIELIGHLKLQVRLPLIAKMAPQEAQLGICMKPSTGFQRAARSGKRRVPLCPSKRRPMLTVTS